LETPQKWREKKPLTWQIEKRLMELADFCDALGSVGR